MYNSSKPKESSCQNFPAKLLQMAAEGPSKMMVPIYQTTRRHFPQWFTINIHCRQETAYCRPHKRVDPADVILECRYHSAVSPDRYIMFYATQFHIFFHSYQPHSVLPISSAATSLENSHKTTRTDALTCAFKTASLDVKKQTWR